MSAPAANCPSCGAPVKFLWSSAVQTTCEFCHSILVRTDVDLKKVGEVADLAARRLAHSNRDRRRLPEQKLCRGRPHHLRIRARRMERMAHRLQRRIERLALGCAARIRSVLGQQAADAVARGRLNPPGANLSVEQQDLPGDFPHQRALQGRARRTAVSNIRTNPMCSSPISEPPAAILGPSTIVRTLRCCFLGAPSSSMIYI